MQHVFVLNVVKPLDTEKGFHFILGSFAQQNVKRLTEEII
jgi:hypothetical protein